MSQLRTMLILCAVEEFHRGDEVTVDGLQGRGEIVKIIGRRLTVRYRDGMYVSRDQRYVHSLSGNQYSSPYYSGRS